MTSSNKYKILVIEDEANIRSFVETILETNGYQVFTAGSCRQGMLMYSSYCPDLIILDLGLPDADGLEFIRYARKSGAVPILVLSARTSEKDKVSALDLGRQRLHNQALRHSGTDGQSQGGPQKQPAQFRDGGGSGRDLSGQRSGHRL